MTLDPTDRFELRDPFDLMLWDGKWVGNDKTYDDRFMSALPRILRLLVAGELTGVYLDRLPQRFAEAGWPNWPTRERAMVDDQLTSLWRTTLTEHPSKLNAHELLTFCTQMTRDPTRGWPPGRPPAGPRPPDT